jgi:hypothetical protein
MSSVTDPQPDPTADEIVAYLDGELPPQECKRVESRLATDDEYRQQMHELDQAWEALNSLPTPTVDEGFARTTIELACVAAEADLTEHNANAKVASRNRAWRWAAAGIAAILFGLLIGRSLLPAANTKLLADLPAIEQLNTLEYVEDVDFLRRLSNAVPAEELIKDKAAYERKVNDLRSTNDRSLDERRNWVESLTPEQKADLADRTRAFADLEPASGEQERMRRIMADIRNATDAPKLQQTLVAYGQWLASHSAGKQEEIREELLDAPTDKQVDVIKKRLNRDADVLYQHLSDDDAVKFRQEVMRLGMERRGDFTEKFRENRKGGRPIGIQEQNARQAVFVVISQLRDDRQKTEQRLIGSLSENARAHWDSLGRGQRQFAKPRQFWMWLQDAMKFKATPQDLEDHFASDKLKPEEKQRLLNQPRAEMDTALERHYLRSELEDNPPQLIGEFGEPGRPRGGPGMGPPQGDRERPMRPRDLPPRREPGPNDRPNDRRPPNGPPRPPLDGPPPEPKPQAI